MKGKVLAVGPGKVRENGAVQPMAVKVGDMVLFKKYGPDEIELDGKKYLVGDEDDILAIIDGGTGKGVEPKQAESNRQNRTETVKADAGL